MKKTRLLLFISLVILAILPLNGNAAAQTGTVVYVGPELTEVEPGDSFTVEVWVKDVVDLWAFDVTIFYDTDYLTFDSAEFGDFISPDMQPALGETSPGAIQCAASQNVTISPDPQSGDGVLCRISFTAKVEEKFTYLTIDTESILSDTDGFVILYSPEHGAVQIGDAEPGFEAFIPVFLH